MTAEILSNKLGYAFMQHAVVHNPRPESDWNANIFKSDFEIRFQSYNSDEGEMEFDMIHLDYSFANAIRRILVSEVPSVAIERVYMTQNTTIMADEMLCHRLGLIPLNVDPKNVCFPDKKLPDTENIDGFDPSHHLLFDLAVKFPKSERNAKAAAAKKEAPSGDDSVPLVLSKPIYSSDLKWVPLPGQQDEYGDGADATVGCSSIPAPVSDNILLMKLTSGAEVMARCLAVKGIGRDHAKFSPVSAAFYKFHPRIRLLRTIEGEEAEKLKRSFAPGVIEVDPVTQVAHVANERLDNGSREFQRHAEFCTSAGALEVGLDERHFIFHVETIAPQHRPPSTLVLTAIDVMLAKCAHFLAIVDRPDFGQSVGVDVTVPALAAPSATVHETTTSTAAAPSTAETSESVTATTETSKTRLNGREVSLEVIHMSDDKRTATYSFGGEDHTMGSALRFCVLRSKTVILCGYCVPHPLEDLINFEIQSKSAI